MEKVVIQEKDIVEQLKVFRKGLFNSAVDFDKNQIIQLPHTSSNSGRMILAIPYCGIIFNVFAEYSNSSKIPDLTWEDHLDSFNPDINYVALAAQKSSNTMLCLVSQLISQLEGFMFYRLPSKSALVEDLLAMKQMSKLKDTTYQVFVKNEENENPKCQIRVVLPIDVASLKSKVFGNPSDDFHVDLTILFSTSNYKTIARKIAAKYVLSPALAQAYLSCGLKCVIDGFQPKDKTFLQYLVSVQDGILTELSGSLDSLQNRRVYISQLTKHLRGGIVEFDNINFLWSSYLVEYNDFHFILQVNLTTIFPSTTYPTVKLRSIYHGNKGVPLVHDFTDKMPYSPRWAIDHMVTRFVANIPVIAELFMKSSTQ